MNYHENVKTVPPEYYQNQKGYAGRDNVR